MIKRKVTRTREQQARCDTCGEWNKLNDLVLDDDGFDDGDTLSICPKCDKEKTEQHKKEEVITGA